MNLAEAVQLIGSAIRGRSGAWADLGAGDGTFTRVLVELLGPESRVYAIDRDPRAVAALARWASKEAPNVTPLTADFTQPFDPRCLVPAEVDGLLLANALHFVPDAENVLARLAEWLRPGGRAVFVEYDRRRASRWVPYPIPAARLPALVASAGLSPPIFIAMRPSAFGGSMYVAVADRIR